MIPTPGKVYRCLILCHHTKKHSINHLKYVDEADVKWRYEHDLSEFDDRNYRIIEWREA